MNQFFVKSILFLLAVFSVSSVQAQQSAGSTTVENSTVAIAEGTTEMRFSEGTYFGPEADWTVDGTLEIWSSKIWIAPGATFAGTGRITLHNPASSPYYDKEVSAATVIDGNNGAFIQLLVEHRNDANVILEDLSDPGYQTSNPAGAQSAQLNLGDELNLAVNGANVVLNGNNLAFDQSGTITNYNANRMVITSNSISGHMIKLLDKEQRFTFPLGISAKDYTPVVLSPFDAAEVQVSVQDYAGSNARIQDRELGMDRNWHIFSSNAVKADVTLYHNVATSGKSYLDADAQIAQYASGMDWQLLPTQQRGAEVHMSLSADLVGSEIENGVWFTKLTEGIDDFFIPNVFTPNGDGNNDVFEIKGIERFDRVSLIVFNRWGNEVYRNPQYQNNWTGQGLNEGTYYYLITTLSSGKEQSYKGWVLLKR